MSQLGRSTGAIGPVPSPASFSSEASNALGSAWGPVGIVALTYLDQRPHSSRLSARTATGIWSRARSRIAAMRAGIAGPCQHDWRRNLTDFGNTLL